MDYILWHSSQLCKSKVLKTEQQNTSDSLRTFCLDQFAFSRVLCKFTETKIWVYTDRFCKIVNECQDTKKLPRLQPKRHSKWKSFSENNCQHICKSRFFNELHASGVFFPPIFSITQVWVRIEKNFDMITHFLALSGISKKVKFFSISKHGKKNRNWEFCISSTSKKNSKFLFSTLCTVSTHKLCGQTYFKSPNQNKKPALASCMAYQPAVICKDCKHQLGCCVRFVRKLYDPEHNFLWGFQEERWLPFILVSQSLLISKNR